MNPHEPAAQRFLVEWYHSELARTAADDIAADLDVASAAVSAEGAEVQVLVTLAAPTDDVLFGVFAAESADAVRRVCQKAGWPPDRITADIHTHVTGAGQSPPRAG